MGNYLTIRWLNNADLSRVIEIENDSFSYPWTQRDFAKALNNRQIVSLAASDAEGLLGYLVYEVGDDGLEVLNVAVDPAVRREGVATALVEHVLKFADLEDSKVEALVYERNMAATLFFRSLGFLATELVKNPYLDGQVDMEDDAIRMEWGA